MAAVSFSSGLNPGHVGLCFLYVLFNFPGAGVLRTVTYSLLVSALLWLPVGVSKVIAGGARSIRGDPRLGLNGISGLNRLGVEP